MLGAAPAIALGLFALFLVANKPRKKTASEVELEAVGVDPRSDVGRALLQLQDEFHNSVAHDPDLLQRVNNLRELVGLEPLLLVD